MKTKFIYFFCCLLLIANCQLPLNAQTWHAIGHGVGSSSSYYFSVSCLKVINNSLYVGGNFKKEFGAPGDDIAKFDGFNWDSLGCSIGIGPLSLDNYTDNKIYVGGGFGNICDDPSCSEIARWTGGSWENVNYTSPNGTVYSVASFNNELYIGGGFSSINSLNVKRIARWDGSTWHDVGGGVLSSMTSSVLSMTVYNGELIVGGYFLKAGSDTVNNIAAWDGSQWHALGKGTSDVVWSLYTDTITNTLYAGGNFTYVDDTIPVNYIASWDGQKWHSLPDTNNAFYKIASIYSITKFNDKLYAGGMPTYPATNNDTALLVWDGIKWEKVPGPNATIKALTIYKGNLYAGGEFNKVSGDTSIKYIACYGDSCPCNVGINEVQSDKTEYLWQNIPNPFNNTTSIPYYVPNGSKGFLQIIDTKGELVDEYALQQAKNTLTVSLEYLKAGAYFYSIIIDGIKKDSKKMILQ